MTDNTLNWKAERARRLQQQTLHSLAAIAIGGVIGISLFVGFLHFQNEKRIAQDELARKEHQEKLHKFIADMNCKVVGKRDGAGLLQRAQTGYMCSDGVTYWKND